MKSAPLSSDFDMGDRIWGSGLAFWLVSILLLGGTGFPWVVVQTYFTTSAIVLIAIGLWRLRGGMPNGAASVAAILAAASLAVLMAQLVPIPFSVWKTLPGRDVATRAFDAIGQSPLMLPLSLSPSATAKSALSLLPPLAAFLAVLSMPRRHFWMMSAAIVACALVGSVIGILQNRLGADSGLFFYHDPGSAKFAAGTFANRNFFAAQLYASVPFLAALAMVVAQRWHLRPAITSLFTLIYIGLLVAVLAAVGSRAGILLAMASVLLTVVLVFRPAASARFAAGKSVLVLLAGIVVMAQASMVGILRLSQSDPLNDFRNTIAAVSFKAAEAQFPAGSGFGSFVPVYQLYETPQTIIDPYINQAHNEWLQLAIEGGAPALVLMAIFLLWLFLALVRTMRLAAADPANAHIRAAAVATVLLLLHAIVDFPFRTDALLTMFGLCAGFLALASAPQGRLSPPSRGTGGRSPGAKPGSQEPQSFRPAGRSFAGRGTPAAKPAAQRDLP